MRLLNISTLELKEFGESNLPPYYIASHRWTTDETTYKDVKKKRQTTTIGYHKVENFCRFLGRTNVPTSRAMSAYGIHRDCQWLWIDTACIDKTSSADVTESINSMFHYYEGAEVCFAYLKDVGSTTNYEHAIMDFMASEWFKRGWTLQELLAPRIVVFLTRHWEILGHKCQTQTCDLRCDRSGARLNAKIANITNINISDLNKPWNTDDITLVDLVMRASQGRHTDRVEDKAYCLLGLLGVSLVPLYGERKNAMARFWEEIEKKKGKKKKAQSALSTWWEVPAGSTSGAAVCNTTCTGIIQTPWSKIEPPLSLCLPSSDDKDPFSTSVLTRRAIKFIL